MPDPHNKTQDLVQAAAVTRARQGKDAWNTWAEDPANAGTSVDFSGYDFTDDPISFSGFIFPGHVTFAKCTFGGGTTFDSAKFKGEALFIKATFGGDTMFDSARFGGDTKFWGATFDGNTFFANAKFDGNTFFANAKFGGDVRFWHATFGGDARFIDVTFTKTAGFIKTQFDGKADFSSAVFGGPVYLDGAVFKFVPELRFTKIATHFTLHGARMAYANSDQRAMWLGLSWAKAAHPDDVDRYRRLKELAMAAKDHEREQDFFAQELKAKRHYETHGWALMLNYAYELFSGFGRSIMRPMGWLVGVWAGFGWGHGMVAKLDAGAPYFDGFRLSTAVLLPFVPSARTIYEGASTALYGDAPAEVWALDLAVVVESVLGLGLVFLLGLALRNRFRL
ncbi:MAG: pentapeptide repeat-containing protein [Rhodospirillales bacterium]|nr:pentapeptide repeat-containing protein [Rhodospirillales bacterium]